MFNNPSFAKDIKLKRIEIETSVVEWLTCKPIGDRGIIHNKGRKMKGYETKLMKLLKKLSRLFSIAFACI